jgi:ceramide glucosyltransferase
MVPLAPRAQPRGRSLGTVVARYARWLAVIRAQRPALLASYPLLFGATTPAVLLGLLSGTPQVALAAVLPRLGIAWAARRWAGLPAGVGRLVVDWLLGDLVTWAAFARAATSRRVVWRGRALTLAAGEAGVRSAHDAG